jgi:hypothetical protein
MALRRVALKIFSLRYSDLQHATRNNSYCKVVKQKMKPNPLAMETFDLVAHQWALADQFEMFDAIQDAERMGEYKMAPTDFIERMMGTYKNKKFMPSFATIYDQDEIRGIQWTTDTCPERQEQQHGR